MPPKDFLGRQHVLFALRSLKFLPTPYQSQDSSRVTLAFFCLSALGLFNPSTVVSVPSASPGDKVTFNDDEHSTIDVMIKPAQIKAYTDWVYRQQGPGGGFRGSDSMEVPKDPSSSQPDGSDHSLDPDPPSLIQTYTALLVLGLLRDDFTRLFRHQTLEFVARCQNPDGSFSHFPECKEPPDARTSYAAFVICSVMNDWSKIDLDLAVDFLLRCHNSDGGYGTRPGLESHGGAAYCCLASLQLSGSLSSIDPTRIETIRWLVQRQVQPVPPPTPESESGSEDGSDSDDDDQDPVVEESPLPMAGFEGRPGKSCDACYSFWCTAALALLNTDELLYDAELDRAWLLSCQHAQFGGICRDPTQPPDVYHTYLSLAALSIGGGQQLGLKKLDPAWNVAEDVVLRMKQTLWKQDVLL